MKLRTVPFIGSLILVSLSLLVATPADAQIRLKWKTVASAYSMGDEPQNAIEADATTAAFTVTLRSATIPGYIVVVTKKDASVNAITVAAKGTDSILGGGSATLASQGDTATFYCGSAGKWYKDTAGAYTTGSLAVTGAATIGGGYGSTGVTVSTTGNIQANGTLTVDGVSTQTGAVYVNGGIDRSTAAALAIGATNATSCVITPATTVTGLLTGTAGFKSGSATVLKDSTGDILISTGTTKPADTTTGYAKGSLFIDTDVVSGTSGLYVNVGTNTSCIFKLVTNA